MSPSDESTLLAGMAEQLEANGLGAKEAPKPQPAAQRPQPKPYKINKKNMIIAAVVLGAGWAYTGFASVDNLFYYLTGSGGSECVRFAKERVDDIGWKNKTITTGDMWFKKGYVVVELIATGGGYTSESGNYNKKNNMESRLCVLGGGMIRMPGLLGEGIWR